MNVLQVPCKIIVFELKNFYTIINLSHKRKKKFTIIFIVLLHVLKDTNLFLQ